MGENVIADNCLVDGNRTHCRSRDDCRYVGELGQHHPGLASIELGQRYCDLLQRRVAGTLTEPDHRHRGMRRARLDRGKRVGGSQAQIIVRVDLQLKIGCPP